MQIEDLKRWHWALLGVIAGLIFSYAWQDHDVVGNKYYEMAEIKQNMFEREALSKSRESGAAILQDVRVEPPVRDYENNLRQIVTGKRLRFNPKDQKEYLVPFYYYASIPYVWHLPVPGAKPLPADATVMDYLAAAHTANPLLHYRFAWELQSNWFTALWVIGGVVVIGGIWPTVLNMLLGAGLGRPPKSVEKKEDEAYLSRFGKDRKPQPVLAAKGPTDEDRQRLDEMNAALEGQLAAAGLSLTAASQNPSTNGDDSVAGEVVVPLGSGIAEPAEVGTPQAHAHETEEERRKRFAAGDFYPVARGTKKQ
jgi:hypothetical protein